jgi:hypothetical protein
MMLAHQRPNPTCRWHLSAQTLLRGTAPRTIVTEKSLLLRLPQVEPKVNILV